ncbi:Eco57I restriction-modification methylase domain-containing protein [Burkholderia vietnamiensis]|uniref:Eco57I restriction-modification methylase domain-containing protein n=1 Tax=Burkholderia vietnamiensis TaxID=60552 RepID=UPI001B9816D6|nr:DNA methyltransferase [Burkholderia vietnamiensis]MBR8283940.1 SAM-dependent DNA methyltransferase [Burkholderia vietnamiensis]
MPAHSINNGPLPKPLRTQLENTVKAARDVAEKGASAALAQIAVAEAKAPDYLTDELKALRRRLRVHGRALGDAKSSDETQGVQHLVWEVAYEHWHRMLFARFLAENGLLLWEPGAPVSLDDCEALVQESDPVMNLNAKTKWELAGKLAARMLPQVFKPHSPVFELAFAPEHQRELERLLAGLPPEVFAASDGLGWVYQFWQAKRKDEVNASEVKIGADELPAVTQLFTEPYMVDFLLHNTLGAWWVTRYPEMACSVSLNYLRTLDDGTPAAGNFDGWPDNLADFKLLDPCCGSGHFLVAAFLLLVPMRMAAESLSASDAVEAVLTENLFGLEIDPRCVEVAAFALAFTAWRYPDAGGYRNLTNLNIACTGLPISASESEWLALASGNRSIEVALSELYRSFSNAPILGSLIDFRRGFAGNQLFGADWDEVQPFLEAAITSEAAVEVSELGVVAKGIAHAANYLAGEYHLVVTNPPYLVRGKQSDKLREHLSSYYPAGDADLATVFLERFKSFLAEGGTHASVTPLNWYYLKSYKELREDLLQDTCIRVAAKVGSGATAKASWDVLRALAIVSKQTASPDSIVTGLEAPASDEDGRAAQLRAGKINVATVKKIREAPDSKFVFESDSSSGRLEDYVWSYQGLATADFGRYGRKFWEISLPDGEWVYQHSTFPGICGYAGLEHILHWEKGVGALAASPTARIQGLAALGKKGVVVTQTRTLPSSLYLGEFFDNNVAVLVPKDERDLAAVWAYCSSEEYYVNVRKLDEKLGVTNATLAKVPFELKRWQRVATECFPDGLPEPYSDDPTQWLFHGHPQFATDTLQVAVARLLGYRWPAESDSTMVISDNARALAIHCRKFADLSDDGIVCFPSVRGEKPADERLLNLLIAAWDTVTPSSWKPNILDKLLADADSAGKGLDAWLRDKFFEQHAKLFQYRPFIWHIWDGLKDGFGALVNYHQFDAKKLERLIHAYLGDWISLQETGVRDGVDGAQTRLAAARDLKRRLELILEGNPPYDVFARWKPLAEQPIGWNPDLNDGVRVNIRPFMAAEVLRHNKKPKLNISWDKDRGRDVESAPWYEVFNGVRINDHHLTVAEKEAARDAAREQQGQP